MNARTSKNAAQLAVCIRDFGSDFVVNKNFWN
jgi:hypothetical protein